MGHAWNVLDLGDHVSIVDAMLFPGNALDVCRQQDLASRYVPECSSTARCRVPVVHHTADVSDKNINDMIQYHNTDDKHTLCISDELLIPMTDIDIAKNRPMIGRGSFAKVLEGVYGEQEVAVKKFNGDKFTAKYVVILLHKSRDRMVRNLVSEVRVLKDIRYCNMRCHDDRHPRVVQFYGIAYEDNNGEIFLGLVLERLEASLSDVVHNYNITITLSCAVQLLVVCIYY